MSVVVRSVQESDIGAIESIDEEVTGLYRPGHWEAHVGYYLMRDPESALVAEIDGKVVGFVFGDIRGWEFGLATPTGWLEVIGVAPAQQGKRVAQALVDALLAHWRRRKVASARTMVEGKDGELSRFMQRVGMKPVPATVLEMRL